MSEKGAGEPFDAWMSLVEQTRTASKFMPCPVDPKLLSRALRDATVRALAERNYRIAWTQVVALRERSARHPGMSLLHDMSIAEQTLQRARTLLIEVGGEP